MEKAIPIATNHTRYKQLDSLRGLAALTVFFTHFLGLKAVLPFFYELKITPLGILFNGNGAVMFFFVLSGFVLSLPFINKDRPLKLTAFYTKRIFRIYPAFIAAIIFSILLKDFLFDKTAMASFTNWINNFWNWDKIDTNEIWKTLLLAGPHFNVNLIDPPIWSLVIEMQVSLLLPFFIWVAARSGVALNVALLFIIALLTYRYSLWAIPVFYSGILMAKYKDDIVGAIRGRGVVVIIAILLLAILLYNNTYEFPMLIAQISSPFKYTLGAYLMAAGSCIIMMIVLAGKKITRLLEHCVFTFFGNISYSFYLIHAPLLLTMASLFTNRYALSPVYIFLSAFTLAVAGSYLMFIYIEKPFQRMAKRLVARFRVLNNISV